MAYSLKIPVNDYQLQMLTVMLGPAPYKANFRNAWGKIILSSYSDKNPSSRKKISTDSKYYEIILPTRWLERNSIYFINDESIQDFIEAIDYRFKLDLYTYIDGVMDFKEIYNKNAKTPIVAKMKDAAVRFLDKKGMNEDLLKFETIKKGYQRYKLNLKSFGRVA